MSKKVLGWKVTHENGPICYAHHTFARVKDAELVENLLNSHPGFKAKLFEDVASFQEWRTYSAQAFAEEVLRYVRMVLPIVKKNELAKNLKRILR